MDKKAFLAVGLSLLIWMVWQKYYLEPIQIQQQAAAEAQRQQALTKNEAVAKAEAQTKAAEEKKSGEAQPKKAASVKTLQISNGSSTVTVSNEPFAVNGWVLKDFSRTLEKQDEKISLEDATGFSTQLKVRFSDNTLSQAIDQVWDDLRKNGEREVETAFQAPDVQAQRRFILDETGFGGRIEYSFVFAKEPPKFIFLDLYGNTHRPNDKEGSIFGQAPDKVRANYRDLNGHHSEIGAKLTENRESLAGVKWFGLDTRYFVLALVPPADASAELGAQVTKETLAGNSAVRGSLVFPTSGKKEVGISAKVYFGPKDMARLTSVDPILVDAVDFGWTSFIAIPLLKSLKWLYSYVKNYGVAIIVLTFLIKMLLFPLMYKSMKSMAKMTKLQPQLNALREKYKDDKEKLNVEMMNFMRANGYNPIGGCLPILLQMPIFFALYRVLFNSMELYQAPFAGWIHDLSSPDPFFVTPVLLTGLMYLQQKLSPNTAADPAQQKMLQIMPVLFGAFMLMLPSGLTIYMVVNSAVSILQQMYLNHKLGIKKPAAQNAVAKA